MLSDYYRRVTVLDRDELPDGPEPRKGVPQGSQIHVLLVGGEGEPRVGSPKVEGASVVGTVVEQDRDAKVRVFKYKKRKHYRRTRGHRQSYTAVRIDSIEL